MRIFERAGERVEVEVDDSATSPIRAKWDSDRECLRLIQLGQYLVNHVGATESFPELAQGKKIS